MTAPTPAVPPAPHSLPERRMPSSAVPATTTAVVLPGLVEPDGVQVTTVPVATPAAGQLLVAVEATGISYAEQAMRRGRYYGQPAFPFVPGYDLVGTVLVAGSPADEALVGRRVATMTKTGAWTGHAVVQARDSVLVPDGIAPEDAETVVVNGVTAWQMLHRAARVRPGATVLVFGANGGVGGILVQLAQHHGARVIGAASPRHHDALRAAGVEPVDYADPHLAERVRELAPRGVDAVFDNVGGATTRTAWTLLAPGGTLVGYAIIAAASGTGSLTLPFAKAIGQTLLWNVLPNGRRAAFYDLWAGHTAPPRPLPPPPRGGPREGVRPARRRHHHLERGRPLPPDRGRGRLRPRGVPDPQRQGGPAAMSTDHQPPREDVVPRSVLVSAWAVPVMVIGQFAFLAGIPVAVVVTAAVRRFPPGALRSWSFALGAAFAVPLTVWAVRPDRAQSLSKDIHPVLAAVVVATAVGVIVTAHRERRRARR